MSLTAVIDQYLDALAFADSLPPLVLLARRTGVARVAFAQWATAETLTLFGFSGL